MTRYWNTQVEDDTHPFGKRVLKDQYEPKPNGRISYPDMGGWKSEKEMYTELSKRAGFMEIDDLGRVKIDDGSSYGIHSYTLIYMEED